MAQNGLANGVRGFISLLTGVLFLALAYPLRKGKTYLMYKCPFSKDGHPFKNLQAYALFFL